MKAVLAKIAIAALAFAFTLPATALPFNSMVIFGDSLSDSGNNAVVFDTLFAPATPRTPTPISGNTFIPTFPYASDHYTNGPVWAQIFAAGAGLSATASLLGGPNYAYAGARLGPASGAPPALTPALSLMNQVTTYLGTLSGGPVPAGTGLIVGGGGNDARDALEAAGAAILGGGDPGPVILAHAMSYATNMAAILAALQGAGGDYIVVWNVPDIGKTPAVTAGGGSVLGTAVASAMNGALAFLLASNPALADGVRIFDLFDLVGDIVGDAAAFGLTNVADACAALVGCNPSTYLFWDGIHPTSAGHTIFARAFAAFVPEPGSLALVALAAFALAIATRNRAGARTRR